ncbi:uncharacterized protein BCR38DRAFT_408857 [Pseudomassariella vexata]|uniref:Uncharacterized protein n=1 Tax=Pseudomassariella vexata TaxID=1141098 RepID=A0A1Y2E1A8_9PEZI|nr:uncharacterized protein BCR38DRAFT_408857 [Pseudomassariella vexata]ORY65116.1 hypothetical protein BCR38DRAFT_408857 [Pseudomassariella vexata]
MASPARKMMSYRSEVNVLKKRGGDWIELVHTYLSRTQEAETDWSKRRLYIIDEASLEVKPNGLVWEVLPYYGEKPGDYSLPESGLKPEDEPLASGNRLVGLIIQEYRRRSREMNKDDIETALTQVELEDIEITETAKVVDTLLDYFRAVYFWPTSNVTVCKYEDLEEEKEEDVRRYARAVHELGTPRNYHNKKPANEPHYDSEDEEEQPVPKSKPIYKPKLQNISEVEEEQPEAEKRPAALLVQKSRKRSQIRSRSGAVGAAFFGQILAEGGCIRRATACRED